MTIPLVPTELDLKKIKESLKNYLKGQEQFKDYNFEGSNLSILLEVLSLNTFYNNFYTNMHAAESFLDSAQLRESITSRAKHLNYIPSSKKGSVAEITLSITPFPATPVSIFIDRGYEFFTIIDNIRYYFTTQEAHTLFPNAGVYSKTFLIKEGKAFRNRFIVDTSSILKQQFIVSSKDIDLDSIIVEVFDNVSATIPQIYSRNTDITNLTATTPVYFVYEVKDGYEFTFGDGVLGKALTNGQLVKISYNIVNGTLTNGASKFTPTLSPQGFSNYTVTTVSNAKNGLERETDESIKYLAPLSFENQRRCVNKTDFETIIKKSYPNIDFIRVWGGEENDPPFYGRIYAAIKPVNGTVISEQEKDSIIKNIINPLSVVALQTIIVEPEYLRIVIDSKIKANLNQSSLTSQSLVLKVKESIQEYKRLNLLKFDSSFIFSEVSTIIDDTDEAIIGNQTTIKLKLRNITPIGVSTKIELNFGTELNKGDFLNGISSFLSSGFIYKGVLSFIADNGKGSLFIYRDILGQRILIEEGIGTLDYVTGKAVINTLAISGFEVGNSWIDFSAIPKSFDIVPKRQQILLIEEEDLNVTVL
jgi:hypothetical protein